ncbi:MAG TPA: HupE/UreJ family protein [Phaeodactylibacter sp.]|nr:HupE/UreJ family protein [Phaeodactylibacter sp.]
MVSTFQSYLQLGFHHIADLTAYDHILFIVALCAIYQLREWKRVVLLATAFTIGHSLTLALAVLGVIPVNTAWVEFLIPVTIMGTALYNVVVHKQEQQLSTFGQRMRLNYLFALLFGLIHGMGFSNFLRSSLLPGQEDQLVRQLFAFNIGVELGQLLIVGVILLLSFLALNVLRIRQRSWNLFVSGGAFGIALIMALERVSAV